MADLTEGKWGTQEQSDDHWVICPYCGYKHGDAWEWGSQEHIETRECSECEREFDYWAEHFTTYHTRPKRDAA